MVCSAPCYRLIKVNSWLTHNPNSANTEFSLTPMWDKYNSIDFNRAVSDWHGCKWYSLSFLSRGLWPKLLITEQIESSASADQWRNMIILQRSLALDCFEIKTKMNSAVGVLENQ